MSNNKKEEILTGYLIALEDNLDVVPDYTSAPLTYICNNIHTKSDISVLDVFSCLPVCCCCICGEQPVLRREWREERATCMPGLTTPFRRVCLAFHSSVFILLALIPIMFSSSYLESGYASELQKQLK